MTDHRTIMDTIRALDRIVELQHERTSDAITELRDAITAQDEQIAELRDRLTRHQDRALLGDVVKLSMPCSCGRIVVEP